MPWLPSMLNWARRFSQTHDRWLKQQLVEAKSARGTALIPSGMPLGAWLTRRGWSVQEDSHAPHGPHRFEVMRVADPVGYALLVEHRRDLADDNLLDLTSRLQTARRLSQLDGNGIYAVSVDFAAGGTSRHPHSPRCLISHFACFPGTLSVHTSYHPRTGLPAGVTAMFHLTGKFMSRENWDACARDSFQTGRRHCCRPVALPQEIRRAA